MSQDSPGTLQDTVPWDRPEGAPGAPRIEGAEAVQVLNDNHLMNLMRDARDGGRPILPLGGARRGGRGAEAGALILDMRRSSRVVDWDGESYIATLEAGVTVGALAEYVADAGGSLAGWRREHPDCTIGGLLSAWQPAPHVLWNGHVREACIGLGAVTGAGDFYEYVPAPRKAAGPDLRHLFIGGEGAFGVIATATMGVSPPPERAVALEVTCEAPASALAFFAEAFGRGLRTPNALYSAEGGAIWLLIEGAEDTVDLMVALARGAARDNDLKAVTMEPEAYYDPSRGDIRAGADPVVGRAGQSAPAVALWGSLSTLAHLPKDVFAAGVLYDVSMVHAALHVPADRAAALAIDGLDGVDAVWLEGPKAAVQRPEGEAAEALAWAVSAMKAALDPAGILPRARGGRGGT